ncbi:response regulator [Prosthecobacter sp.]|uniref:response regulator n=1 Tax=Prosthecobacter sp. TaxID=1965333 RepID=UPI0037840491
MKKNAGILKRVLIVDDHPVFRDGMRRMVEGDGIFTVCGEAGTAAEAMNEVTHQKPDLLILDLNLPGKSGLELLQDIHAMMPELPVLVVSMHEEGLFAERVLRAGGRGYVMKMEGPEKIMSAVHRIMAGKVAVSEQMSSTILDSLSRPAAKKGGSVISALTTREFEVFRLIGQGKDTHEIADALHLSTKTVDTHRANIKTKLAVKNNTELVRQAVCWCGEQG